MPIDFFQAPCTLPNGNCQLPGIECKRSTKSKKFGLCDDPPPSTEPAYVQLHSPDDWIAIVNNPNSKKITFKAIDYCVPMLRPNGQLESRCDGMLYFEHDLIFVELKDRASNGWLAKGRDQLTITIQYFCANHNINVYRKIDAYVSNKQRPLAITSTNTEIQKFKDDTANILGNAGLHLKVGRNITI